MDAERLEFADKPDWALLAHANEDLGVGEAARRLFSLMTASGVSVELVQFSGNNSPKRLEQNQSIRSHVTASNVVTCLNADQTAHAVASNELFGQEMGTHVGFWAWELDSFPKSFEIAKRLVDEIWTISEFCQAAISKSGATPVRVVRLPVPVPKRKTVLNRNYFGLEDTKFLVVTSFDFFSDVRRKNPEGSIQSFLLAFPQAGKATLVVKSINGMFFKEEFEKLRDLAKGRIDIMFIDRHFSIYENAALLEIADVVLSLHRSEGYGLNLADAMARKTAVMATGYSGNLDFMDENSSFLVPHTYSTVTRYAGVKISSFWAEPDLDSAAGQLRHLAENPAKLARVSAAGRKKITSEHSLDIAVKRFRDDYCEI